MAVAQVLFPWAGIDDELDLQLAVSVQGASATGGGGPTALPVRFIDVSRKRVDVVGADPGWAAAEIAVTLTAPANPHGLDLTECRGHLVLEASPSATRISAPLRPSQDGSWQGRLFVTSDEIVGVATLRALITQPQPGAAPRILGSSADWIVAFDEGSGPHGSHGVSPISLQWTSFSKPDVDAGHPAELASSPGAVSFCAAGGSEPVLYLNEDIKGLQRLLDAEHPTGLQARVQEVLGTYIALQALTALVDAAVTRIGQAAVGAETEEDMADSADALDGFPALQAALEVVAEAAESVGGYDDAVEQIATAARADDDAGETLRLRSILVTAAQSVAGTPKSTADLLKEVLDA